MEILAGPIVLKPDYAQVKRNTLSAVATKPARRSLHNYIERAKRVGHQYCEHRLDMRTIKTTLTLLLAILWLPVSSHCLLLESASTLEFLSCCAHEDKTTEHHEDECATDSCSIVEGAQYKSSLQRVTVPPLDTHVAFELPPLLVTTLKSAVITAHQSDDALAQLPVAWQFSARTAQPPRAPSLVS